MPKEFRFAGKSSKEFGIYISGQNTFNAPEKDVEEIEIPGRNGTLTISHDRFKNIPVTYPAFIRKDFKVNAQKARAWLLSSDGYQRLEDDYNPDTYRKAQFKGPIDFDMRFLNLSGEMQLMFDCMPQRFLKSGEETIVVSSGDVILNEWQKAKPLIMVYGTEAGTLNVGDVSVQINELSDQIILDSDTENAYRQIGDGAPENKNLTIYAPEFPVLIPGENLITWTGGITKVEIIPRWWTL